MICPTLAFHISFFFKKKKKSSFRLIVYPQRKIPDGMCFFYSKNILLANLFWFSYIFFERLFIFRIILEYRLLTKFKSVVYHCSQWKKKKKKLFVFLGKPYFLIKEGEKRQMKNLHPLQIVSAFFFKG
jgi:hypothetical protein